jgi:hypothetical protein
MGFQSLRPLSPSRSRLATLLALMAPGLGLADDGGNSLRVNVPAVPSLRDDSAAVQVVDHTQLVPLPKELLGPDARDMMILDPRARVGGRASMVPIARFDTEDGWLPRSQQQNGLMLNSPLMGGPANTRPALSDPANRKQALSGSASSKQALSGPMLNSPLVDGPTVLPPTTAGPEESAGWGRSTTAPLRLRIGDSSSSTIQILDFPAPARVGDVLPELVEGSGQADVIAPFAGELTPGADASDLGTDQVNDPEQDEPSARVARRATQSNVGEGAKPIQADDDTSASGPHLSLSDEANTDAETTDGQWAHDEGLEDSLADEAVTVTLPDDAATSIASEAAEAKSEASAESTNSPLMVTESASERTNERGIEIRKLRLSEAVAEENEDAPQDRKAAPGTRADKTIASPASRSAGKSRATVGDVRLDDSAPGAITTRGGGAKRGAEIATVYDNPIVGDVILESGELILASGKTAANLPIKPQTARLKPLIEKGLRYYWDRPEDAAERTHWGMMHSIMVFDRDTQVISRRQKHNAVAWMAGNNPCRNQLFFDRDQDGILVRTGVGLQGHQAQLLAVFGLIDVPSNYPVYAAKQKFTVADILEREKRDCKVNTELTFTLIGLAHYADSDSSWVAGDGQDWSVERVIREELAQPIVGAACGGTHRLMGFGHALRRRRAEEKPITGQWERADRYLKDFVAYTWSLQNRDGSMSTSWYEKSEDNGNMDRKIQTTGHMLEFLMSVTPDAELQSPEMLRTVSFMANTLYNERGHEWQVGPKGHALRSLVLYYQRVFGHSAPWRTDSGARSAATSGRAVR